MALRRTRFIAALTSILALCGGVDTLNAQSSYTLAQRQSLATDLNNALTAVRNGPLNTPVSVALTDASAIPLRNLDGGCDNFVPTGNITLWKSAPATFVLRLTVQNMPVSIAVPPESHQLVCDLNSWLWNVWGGMFFTNTIGNYAIGPAVCYGTQDYFMGGTATMTSDIIGALNGKDGMGCYLNREYSIFDGISTTTKTGDDLFSINRSKLEYIARYFDNGTSTTEDDIKLAKSAFAEITFNDYDDGSRPMLKKLTITAQNQQYSPECSNGPGSPDPYMSRAKLDIEYLEQGMTVPSLRQCWIEYYDPGDDPDSDPSPTFRDENNESLWNNFDTAHSIVSGWCRFDVDASGTLYFKVESTTECPGNAATYELFRIRENPSFPPEYCQYRYPLDGVFCVDQMTGNLIFKACPSASCSTVGCTIMPVPCFDFCNQVSGYQTIANVIDARAMTYSDAWSYDHTKFLGAATTDNRYETGEAGKWRPQETFAYRSNIKGGTGMNGNINQRAYADAGVFVDQSGAATEAFRVFNWKDTEANTGSNWLATSSVTRTSPWGEAVEEHDVLGIYSAAKFAYRNTVPKLVAKNAEFASVDFESFEDGSFPTSQLSAFAHSGKQSFALTDNQSKIILRDVTITQQMVSRGMSLRFWIRPSNGSELLPPMTQFSVNLGPIGSFSGSQIKRIARTGDWILYELAINPIGSQYLNTTVDIGFTRTTPTNLTLDDVRIQPLDAEMMCYVYDPNTLRLTAQFDDQHFALFYQYNGEGKLVRKLKETERGVKTVAETQYHLPMLYERTGALVSSIGPMQGEGAGHGFGDRFRSFPAESATDPDGRNGAGATFDVLDIELGPQGTKVKIFDSEDPTLPDMNALIDSSANRGIFGTAGLSDSALLEASGVGRLASPLSSLEKLKAIDSIRTLERRMAALRTTHREELSDEERQRLEEEIGALRNERKRLIEDRLGISEKELEALYRQLQKTETDEE